MRRFLVPLWLVGVLAAEAPLRVVAVERRGPPPYESADRIYILDGGVNRGLKVGTYLIVRHADGTRLWGRLRVTLVRKDRSETRFENAEEGYPMKGDTAQVDALPALPETDALDEEPIPVAATPRPPGIPAPPHEGLLFFLPQSAVLSPVGLKKLEGWVGEWGAVGRWTIQVPTNKSVKPALQKQRAEALQTALQRSGVRQVELDLEPRGAEGKNEPAWVRRAD